MWDVEVGAPRVEMRVNHFRPQMGGLSQRTTYTCDHRDPYRIFTEDDVYAVQFTSVVRFGVTCSTDEHGDDVEVEAQTLEFNPSKLYLIRGRMLRLSEVEERYGRGSDVHTRMVERGVAQAFLAPGGLLLPFDPADNVHLKDYLTRRAEAQAQ